MKKILFILQGVALFFLLACSGNGSQNSGSSVFSALFGSDTYIIHYHSYSGDYSKRNAIWLWKSLPDGGNGTEYVQSAEDSFGYVFEAPVIDDATQIGIIFKPEGAWDGQSANYYVDVTGSKEIWFLEDDSTAYFSEPSVEPRITYAFLDDFREINFALTSPIAISATTLEADKSLFTLVDSDTGRVLTSRISAVTTTTSVPTQDPVANGYELVNSGSSVHFIFKPSQFGMTAESTDTDWYVCGSFTGWSLNSLYRLTWNDTMQYFELYVSTGTADGQAPIGGEFKYRKADPETWQQGDNLKIVDNTSPTSNQFKLTLDVNLIGDHSYILTCDGFKQAEVIGRGIFNTDPRFQYAGTDLGAIYNTSYARFKVFSPHAKTAKIMVFDSPSGSEPIIVKDMIKGSGASGDKGIWKATVTNSEIGSDIKGKYYTYAFTGNNGMVEMSTYTDGVIDPYAVCVNGEKNRAMVVDFEDLQGRVGFTSDNKPSFSGNPEDAMIYEMSLRDFTIDPNSGINESVRGKYLGLIQKGTTYQGYSTGLDYLGELATMGITHIQIMPFYDFVNDTDESTSPYEDGYARSVRYNWGYMPANFNTPEGWFATEVNGTARITELMRMIKAVHSKKLRIIMDAVYNHTDVNISSLNKIAPYYYFRTSGKAYLNGSGCGDEINSKYYMTRKFLLDSALFWVNGYHIDGFRFDLMGLLDKETITTLVQELKAVDPAIEVHGEGWQMGALPTSEQASKGNQMNRGFACFQDTFRDAIKGSVFNNEKGFVQGATGREDQIILGLMSSNRELSSDPVNGTYDAFTADPGETINYFSCHDNPTAWDRILYSGVTDENEVKKMVKLGITLVTTAQGVPFFHSGCEFGRTKGYPNAGFDNSYNRADGMNHIDWALRAQNSTMVDYFKAIVQMRHRHPMFRLQTWDEVKANVTAEKVADESNLIKYEISRGTSGDSWKKALIFFNGNATEKTVALTGSWYEVSDGETVNIYSNTRVCGTVAVPAFSAVILRQ